MSTGPRTQAALNMMEHDAPHSALLYLFQEVSKLGPPVHHTFTDTHLAATKPNTTSRQTPVMDREDKDAQLFGISCTSCHHTLSCLSPFKQMTKVKDEGHSSSVMNLTEPQPECNTTWKVLSLINLQCERLLSPGDVEGSDRSSSSSFSKTDHSNDNTGTRAAHKMDQGEKSLNDRNPEGVSPRKVIYRVGSGKSQGYTTDSQPAEKTDISITEQEEKSETPSSGNIHVWLHHECKDCLSSKQDILNLSTKNASVNTLLKETHADLTKPTLTLDHNANITSEPHTDPLSSTLPSSQPASHSFNSSQNQPPTDQDDKMKESKPGCVGAPNPAATEPDPSHNTTETNSSQSATSQPEPGPNVAPPAKQQWRIKTPRKQPHPSRSADIQDPDFQGVTFRMDTELDDSKEQCRLLITSKYSRELCRSVKKPRPRTRVVTKSLKTSSSDEENDPTTTSSKGKVCASCCTRKTPMWRDADDGTPLCNACGIRYKKYRVRCVNCWHIPRKESNSSSHCLKCGNFVKLTSAQRKHKT